MDKKPAFTKLFTPINIGPMTLRNRIAMAPMGTRFAAKKGLVTERMKDFYEVRARGGFGLIIVESTDIDYYRCADNPYCLAIDNDRTLPGLSELAKVIKKHGARAAIQITHHGRQTNPALTGFQPVAPSAIPSPSGVMPRELRIAEIPEILHLYTQAATRAKKAGFEGIEVHAAHRYLLATFQSPLNNKRKDRYGGSLENRARLLIEVLKAIRGAVGDDFPLWARINALEFTEGEAGLTQTDSIAIAKMISEVVNAIHISAFGYGKYELAPQPEDPGGYLHFAAAIKKAVKVPVIAVGRLTPAIGEQALRDGKADIIAIGRGTFADPEIPNKASSGRGEDIIPCITCYHCHDVRDMPNAAVECAVNVTTGKERESVHLLKPAKKIKKVAVIGGGPAGMEAARVLASRGHNVVLFEKESSLGGQLRLAIVAPHKRERIEPLITYYITQLKKLNNVAIRLNTEAGIEVIESLQPDAVILAAGSYPVIPELLGADQNHVVIAHDILAGKAQAGRKVVVVGGGSIGCETAEYLFEQGKEVTLIRFRAGVSQLATDLGNRDRFRFLARFTALPIKLLTDTSFNQIKKSGVIGITKENRELLIEADTVVISAGTKQNNGLFSPLKAMGFETHIAGDCWHVGRIADAIGDGLRLGCAI